MCRLLSLIRPFAQQMALLCRLWCHWPLVGASVLNLWIMLISTGHHVEQELPLSPSLCLCSLLYNTYVTCQKCSLLQGDPFTSSALSLPPPYLPAPSLKYFAFDCVLCFTSCWRHQLTVPCGMWPLLPGQVCYASSSATHTPTLALSLPHTLSLFLSVSL